MQPSDVFIADNAVQAIEKRLASFDETRDLMQRIGRVMKTDIQLNFRRGESPRGEKWAPLKLRQGQPLRDTGRLMRSIDFAAEEDEVSVGTNVKYAPVHQFGATIKPKRGPRLVFQGPNGPIFAKQVTIPARPFIGIAGRQVAKINREIENWANDK